jgi:hypothetical protein
VIVCCAATPLQSSLIAWDCFIFQDTRFQPAPDQIDHAQITEPERLLRWRCRCAWLSVRSAVRAKERPKSRRSVRTWQPLTDRKALATISKGTELLLERYLTGLVLPPDQPFIRNRSGHI